jgi:hypothetical protein
LVAPTVSRAATATSIAIEPERSTLRNGPVAVEPLDDTTTDNTASGGGYIKFGREPGAEPYLSYVNVSPAGWQNRVLGYESWLGKPLAGVQAIGADRCRATPQTIGNPDGPRVEDQKEANGSTSEDNGCQLSIIKDANGNPITAPILSTFKDGPAKRRLNLYVSMVPSGQKRGVVNWPFPVNSPFGAADSDPAPSLTHCAQGMYNSAWTSLAKNLVGNNQGDAIVRPGREFNGDWYAWHVHPGEADDPSTGTGGFVGCWKTIVEQMRAISTAFQFMWSPVMGANATDPRTGKPWDPRRAFPDGLDSHGLPYVDWIAPDTYDTDYTTNGTSDWTTAKVDPHHVPATQLTKAQQKWTVRLASLKFWHDFATIPSPASVTGPGVNHRVVGFAVPEWGIIEKPQGEPKPGKDGYVGGGDDAYFVQKMHDFLVDPANNVDREAFWEGFSRGLFDADEAPVRRTANIDQNYSAWRWLPNARAAFYQLFHTPPAPVNNCGDPTRPVYSVTTQQVNVAAAGTYALWSRMRRDAVNAKNDSYLLQVDNQCIRVGAGVSGSAWGWVASSTVNLTAGMHTVRIIGDRQGVAVDRILLVAGSCDPRTSADGFGSNCVSVAPRGTDAAGTDTTRPTVNRFQVGGNEVNNGQADDGVTVSGVLALNAFPSDASGTITRVDYYLDGLAGTYGGAYLGGSADASSDYFVSWDTSKVSADKHVVYAVATDAFGNQSVATTASTFLLTVKRGSASK